MTWLIAGSAFAAGCTIGATLMAVLVAAADDRDLDDLTAGLDRAYAIADAMRAEAERAIETMRDDRRRHAADVADLEARLAEASAALSAPVTRAELVQRAHRETVERIAAGGVPCVGDRFDHSDAVERSVFGGGS